MIVLDLTTATWALFSELRHHDSSTMKYPKCSFLTSQCDTILFQQHDLVSSNCDTTTAMQRVEISRHLGHQAFRH